MSETNGASRRAGMSGRLEGLRRDLGVLLDDLRGRHPPPVLIRPPGRYLRSGTAAAARALTVLAVRRETHDAVTIVLGDGAPLPFVPGQFLTLLVTLEGQTHRRAYSICSDVRDTSSVAITAKRIGRVSGYLNERLREGDVLPVLGPSGEFVVPRGADDLVFIAGGSGITPIMAILRARNHRRATLVYGNRSPVDIIFRDELRGLDVEVRHVLEAPDGRRLDRATLAAELDAIGPRDEAHYFVCGPAPVMASAREELAARGVVSAHLHEERFATAERSRPSAGVQRLTVKLGRGPAVHTLVPADGSILDAGLAAGVAMPFSCTMGGCGACAATLVEGEIDLDEPNCLTPAERARGRILACVARPRTSCTVEIEPCT